jgi:predicted transcriptional regulator
MDEKLLASLDLNSSEIALYRAVLAAGGLSPAELAKASSMKRTTAYSVAGSLVEKGLLIEDATRRPRIFTPATPDDVRALIDRDRKQLVAREELYQSLADELGNISAQNSYPVPTVRFIEEEKISAFLRTQSPVWDKNLIEVGELTWWGFQDHSFVEHHKDWIQWYWKSRPEIIDLKLLSNRAEAEVNFAKNVSKSRAIKFWGEANSFLSTTWVIGDYVVMINTRQKPFYLVEIHDRLMAHDQREVFRNLWEMV